MKNFFAIVKVLLIQQLRVRPSENSKKKRGGRIAIYVVLAVCFLPMLVMVALGMFVLGKVQPAESVRDVVTFLILICQGLVLLFGLPSLISNVFMCKDGERLLAMPVSMTTVFSAKLFVAYGNEVVTTAVTVLTVLLPFGIGSAMGAGYFLMLLPALILIPLLPMLLGCLFSIPISFLLAKIGRNGIAKAIFQMVMFLGFMGLYLWFIVSVSGGAQSSEGGGFEEMLEQLINNLSSALSASMKYVYPDYWLAGALCAVSLGGWAASFFSSLGANAVLLALVVLISLPFYKRTLSLMLENSGSRKKSDSKFAYKNKGVLQQLIATDFKRVFRDSQMGFQGLAAVFMMPLLVVIIGIMWSTSDASAIFSVPGYEIFAPIAIMAYMVVLGSSSNVLALYPLSRENKSFYMLKTYPVEFGKILTAKVILSTAVMTAGYILTGLISVFLLRIEWYWALCMTICMVLFGFATMCITTRMDLKSPKLGWTNFNQSLKNAKNSWAGLVCGLIMGAIMAAVTVPFALWYLKSGKMTAIIVFWAVIAVIGVVFALVAHKFLVGKAQKMFDEIEA